MVSVKDNELTIKLHAELTEQFINNAQGSLCLVINLLEHCNDSNDQNMINFLHTVNGALSDAYSSIRIVQGYECD